MPDRWKIINAKLEDWSASYSGPKFHAVLCDPPYSISFMGREWDSHTEAMNPSEGYYLAGLTDGEGCFRIHRERGGDYYACHFQIKLRRDDRHILEMAQRYLGVGVVRDVASDKTSKPLSALFVHDREGCKRVRSVFRRFPLRGKKARDFIVWCEALDAWETQGRGNRWQGAVDKSRIRAAYERMKQTREYRDPPWSGHPFQDQVRVWGESLLPHLYPGALVLMFGGTRTWHRLACGMEDAGFEMWDTLMWLHAQGFPKAQDISKLIDKAGGESRELVPRVRVDGKATGSEGSTFNACDVSVCSSPDAITNAAKPWSGHKTTALKPAWEPVLCFKKPLTGTYAEMAMQYGSGALNVDGGRIATDEQLSIGAGGLFSHIRDGKPYPGNGRNGEAYAERRYNENGSTNFAATPGPRGGDPSGRYPANLILDPESAAMLDGQAGDRPAGASVTGCEPSDPIDACYGEYTRVPFNGFGDSGGASRFYYCAKASSEERNAGLEGFEKVAHGQSGGAQQALKEGKTEYLQDGHIGLNRIKMVRNHHPTVKPIDLCRYLATLLLPPDSVQPRRLLVPFSGSGSEMIGALQAGWDEIVGIEQDVEHGYVAIAEARLARFDTSNPIVSEFVKESTEEQPGLF